ncbi:hypothetical protein D3C79_1075240 [compost metagenome]
MKSYDLTETIYVNVGRADYTEIRVDGVLVPDGDNATSKKLLLKPVLDEAAGAADAANQKTE